MDWGLRPAVAVRLVDSTRSFTACPGLKVTTQRLGTMTFSPVRGFRRMVTADLVLIAAPVFCQGFPAQIKGLLDRMFCMMDFDGERPGAPRLHDKPMALLLTGGGQEADNADMVIRGFQNLVKYLKGRMVGHLFVAGCTTPEKIGDDVKARSVEFAMMLDEQAR